MLEGSRFRKTLWRQGKPSQKSKQSLLPAERGTTKSHFLHCKRLETRPMSCPLHSLVSEESCVETKGNCGL